MNRVAAFWAISFLTLLGSLYWAQLVLPEVAATTFGFDNQVTGSMSRKVFLYFFLSLSGFVNLLFFAICRADPEGIMLRMANLPRKKYWLDPSRAKVGIVKIRTMIAVIATSMNLMWVLSVVFLVQINLGRSLIGPGEFVLGMFAIVAVLITWCYRFSRDPN